MQREHVAQHRIDQRVELGDGLGVAPGELALADPGLEHEFQRERPKVLRCLGQPAAEDAQELQRVLIWDACLPRHDDPPRGFELVLAVGGVVWIWGGEAHRTARREAGRLR